MDLVLQLIAPNSLTHLSVAGLMFAFVVTILYLAKVLLSYSLSRVATRTRNTFDDLLITILDRAHGLLFIAIGIWMVAPMLILPERIFYYMRFVAGLCMGWYGIVAISIITQYLVLQSLQKNEAEKDNIKSPMLESLVSVVIKVVIWTAAILLFLQNMGVQITALLGGLGIGGVAIAFAFQRILEDFFSYFAIYLDEPFKIGDFVKVGVDAGTVEHIGIKTTRIRTLLGDQLVIPNKEVINARVNNFKKLERRRIATTLTLTYETSVANLKAVPKLIEEIITTLDSEHVEFDRCHFTDLASFSLNFELVYFIKTSDYKTYLDIQQEINLVIMETFKKHKITFAYPTQTVYVQK